MDARRAVVEQLETIEVRLTDQLLQLTEMRDDCETAAGRAVVKAEMERLQRLGRSLRSLSGSRCDPSTGEFSALVLFGARS